MAVPPIAGTGQFFGPYQYLHLTDTTSFWCGSSDPNAAGTIFGSSKPISGIIHSLIITNPAASSATGNNISLQMESSTGASALQNNSSAPLTFFAFTAGTYVLDIGFNTGFNIHAASTPDATLTVLFNTP